MLLFIVFNFFAVAHAELCLKPTALNDTNFVLPGIAPLPDCSITNYLLTDGYADHGLSVFGMIYSLTNVSAYYSEAATLHIAHRVGSVRVEMLWHNNVHIYMNQIIYTPQTAQNIFAVFHDNGTTTSWWMSTMTMTRQGYGESWLLRANWPGGYLGVYITHMCLNTDDHIHDVWCRNEGSDVYVSVAVTILPTPPTMTTTPTSTVTSTATTSPTASPTVTATSTASPTVTASCTMTATSTASSSATATPTTSPTRTTAGVLVDRVDAGGHTDFPQDSVPSHIIASETLILFGVVGICVLATMIIGCYCVRSRRRELDHSTPRETRVMGESTVSQIPI